MTEKGGGVPTPPDFFSWLNSMVQPPQKAATGISPETPVAALPADPFEMWKNLTKQNQDAFAKLMQQMVGTPDFAQTLGKASSDSANYRKMVKQAAKGYLEAANMPTRDDISRLGEQLVNLDAKVDDLLDQIGPSLDALPVLTEHLLPALENLRTRLEGLEKRLERMEKNQTDHLAGTEPGSKTAGTEITPVLVPGIKQVKSKSAKPKRIKTAMPGPPKKASSSTAKSRGSD